MTAKTTLTITLLILLAFSAVTTTAASNPYNYPTETLALYMLADTYSYNNITGYGLATDYNNTNLSIPTTTATTNATITYGFRVYTAASATVYTELTSGAPTSEITISGNQTVQTRSGSWNCPDTTLTLGSKVLKIDLYAKINSGSYTLIATFLSNPLMTKELMPTTWTLSLNLQATSITSNTTSTLTFGDSTYRSTITGISIVTPPYTDIQSWQWRQGDLIGLILGSYLHLLGAFFWVLVYLIIFGGLYFRHRTASPVVFIVILLGGGGSFGVWVLFPPIVAAIFSVFILFAIAAIIFKILR